MENLLAQVRAFHRQIGAPVAETPRLLPGSATAAHEAAARLRELGAWCGEQTGNHEELLLRLNLALEELAEWLEAHAAGDLVAAADAWGDRLYLLLGDAVAAGLPGEAIFAEIHESNMTKTITRPDLGGKGHKSSAYRPPRLAELLAADLAKAGPRPPSAFQQPATAGNDGD